MPNLRFHLVATTRDTTSVRPTPEELTGDTTDRLMNRPVERKLEMGDETQRRFE